MIYEYSDGVLYCGNCLDVLKMFPENSIDSIVTDPPYGIKFMNKKWDCNVPGVEIWSECFRVLKPGGHLLSFSGTRTFHRMTCNIEDAGFEIRDMIAWIYGSGFPKSLNISKAIDKIKGVEREIIGESKRHGGGSSDIFKENGSNPITAPATDEAKKWDGFGTALKPAIEPVTLARKPISETNIAENVLKHGTGGINIDDCRIEYNGKVKNVKRKSDGKPDHVNPGGWKEVKRTANRPATPTEKGRFPANIILDGSDEVLNIFPESLSSKSGYNFEKSGNNNPTNIINNIKSGLHYGDKGSAARFFYIAKAGISEKNDGLEDSGIINSHVTVKPVKLMRYLIRLVTPPGGTILDPFIGSGSTGKAAFLEQKRFIGIEINPEYFEIAKARIEKEQEQPFLDF